MLMFKFTRIKILKVSYFLNRYNFNLILKNKEKFFKGSENFKETFDE